MEFCKLGKEINKGFALMIFNENCKYYYRADADRENIKTFCKNAQFTVNATKGLKTDNLTADGMEDLLKNIAKTDFGPYDAFICFIVSACNSQGVLGVDGYSLSVGEIIGPIIRCASLANKPKIFFIHNCKENRKDTGPRITTPVEADVLVVFSGVLDTCDVSATHESSYITALTKVFHKYAHCMNLTDMLAMVNHQMFAKLQHCDRKKTPVFMSSLREAVHFGNFMPGEIPR